MIYAVYGRVKEKAECGTEIPWTCEDIHQISSQSSTPEICCDVAVTCRPEAKHTKQNLSEISSLSPLTLIPCASSSPDSDEFTVCLNKIEEKFNEFTQNLIKTFECDNSLSEGCESDGGSKIDINKSPKNLETIVEESNLETDSETYINKCNEKEVSGKTCVNNEPSVALNLAENSKNVEWSLERISEESTPVSTDADVLSVGKDNEVFDDTSTVIPEQKDVTVNSCEVNVNLTVGDDVQGLSEHNSIAGNESPSLTSRTEEQAESLDVNIDSSSVGSLSDDCQEDFCTQYSDSESVKDFFLGDTDCNTPGGIPHSQSIKDELIAACCKVLNESYDENGVTSGSRCEVHESNTLTNIAGKFVEVNGKFKQANSMVKDLTESDISVYESFYSLDNSCTATPVIGRIKKTLTWTPRVLSEERFLNSRSTTLSSKASFYTAETSGTFYSARSLQLDSCDNFVTCEDFQKLRDLNREQKSKLSKAKDALARGRDFVKSKFDCYRKRLPSLGSANNGNNSEKKSRNLCHKTCGFSCVSQVGKEISQYSLPDLQSDTKGNNQLENNSGYNSKEDAKQLPQIENNNVIDDAADGDMAVTMREKGKKDDDREQDKNGVNFDETGNNGKKPDAEKEGVGSGLVRPSERSNSKHESRANTDIISRETTDDIEDDLPVGTEAGTMTQKMKESRPGDDTRSKKRLRWVSAIERTQGTSSSLTSNSSVEQLLYQREMDPEMLLSNLGFGGSFLGDDSLCRIPERFLPHQPASPSPNQYHMTANHPEFQQMLPVMGTSQLMHGANSVMQEPVNELSDEDEIDGDAGNQMESYHQSRKGSMQRPTFSALAQGVKFIHGTQVHQAPPSPDEETKRICAIPSILDFPNRKALALQGFYGDNYLSDLKSNRENGSTKRSLSAAEKRRKFVHSVKSKGNWSLTDENEEDRHPDNSGDSWDRGLQLKSFSDRFSSDSSLESSDSYCNEEQKIVKSNSIKNLRKQYEDTIRRSFDSECPVFSDAAEDSTEKTRRKSIGEMRKKQVNRLMTSIDDDGDYVAQTNQSRIPDVTGFSCSSLDPKSILMQAQKSTQSTITGSPTTPLDLGFSFDQSMNDGELEFNFNGTDKSSKFLQCGNQSVSIIVEEDSSQLESATSGEVIQKSQNSSDLNTLSLGLRSDSCNTLVPIDHLYDSENTEGELTPRAGQVSPGLRRQTFTDSAGNSTENSISLDHSDSNKENLKLNEKINGDVIRSRSSEDTNCLKPLQHSAPESFELEEVSSGETVYEDFHVQTNKPVLLTDDSKYSDRRLSSKQGPLEKSMSMNSDSSGFADLDPAGEIIQPMDSQSGQEQKSFVSQQQDAARQTPKKELYVCQRNTSFNSEDEHYNPSLSSITYSKTEQVVDKSLVFTVNVPIEMHSDTESSISRTSSQSRFVSTVCLNVEATSKDPKKHHDKSVSKVTPVGQVTYLKVNPSGDLDPEIESSKISINDSRSDKSGTGKVSVSDIDLNASPFRMKNKVQERIRAKERLVVASNNTADWLLESNKCFDKTRSPYNVGKPAWASTPNLKYKKASHVDQSIRNRIKREGNHSFDVLLDEEQGTRDANSLHRQAQTRNQLMARHSVDQFDTRQHFLESRDQSEYSSIDESLDQQSLIGSSCGVPEDHLNYLRLARLINGPSLMMDISKMPNSKFTPNFHMKNWMQLPKRKHLEEETLLMQHAVQRYKTELCLMENMLFSLYRSAHPDLNSEERSEVEELQHLWCEVRKEVIKMEEMLSERLKAVMSGNNAYSPLDALEIVQQMIDLLREQLYHQQMCIGRDISFNDEDEDVREDSSPSVSATSSSVSESWMSDISSQMSDIKSSISASELSQKQELQNRISELKKGLLFDVRREISDTQNAEMLKLQLQARENEVKKLRMELLLQNVSIGKTRKKQVFESDV